MESGRIAFGFTPFPVDADSNSKRETSRKNKAARGGRTNFCGNTGPDVSSFYGIVCRCRKEKRCERYHYFSVITTENKTSDHYPDILVGHIQTIHCRSDVRRFQTGHRREFYPRFGAKTVFFAGGTHHGNYRFHDGIKIICPEMEILPHITGRGSSFSEGTASHPFSSKR